MPKESIDKQISLSDYIQKVKPNPLPAVETIQYKISEIKSKKEKATSKAKENRKNEKRYQSEISRLTSEIEELERNIEIANTKIQHLPGIRKKLEQYKADLTRAEKSQL